MSATASAPATSGMVNSTPAVCLPPPAQKPAGQCATSVTITMSPNTRPGPMGPPRPRIIRIVPPISATSVTAADGGHAPTHHRDGPADLEQPVSEDHATDRQAEDQG